MNKSALIQCILAKLVEDFDTRQSASRKTRTAGNDPESKSEGKYDTRSIEENYLADGLAKQALVAAQAAAAFGKLSVADFAPDAPIDLGAVVELVFPGAKEWFLLGPAAGGLEVEYEGKTITVITPESPIGAQLMGIKSGDSLKSPAARMGEVL